MVVSVEVRVSQALYDEAQAVADAENRTVEETLATWAELGKEALSRPDLALRLLESALATETEILDGAPQSDRLQRLWAALGGCHKE